MSLLQDLPRRGAAFVDRFIPPSLRDDDGLRRDLTSARLLVTASFMLCFGALLWSALLIAWGFPSVARPFLIAVPLGLIVPLALRRTGRVVELVNLLGAVMFATLIASALMARELTTTAHYTMVLVVVLATLAGWRTGLFWLVMCAIAPLILRQQGPDAMAGMTQVQLNQLESVGAVLVVLTVFIITASAWWQARRAVGETAVALQALAAARDQAEASSRAKSVFLASMSHEIRTPMNGVIGMTELALSTELSDEQREYLDIVQESSQQLLRILNDILDLSKIESGRLDMEVAPFSLRDTLGTVLDMVRLNAEKKGLTVDAQLAPDLPEAFIGDSVRLSQVLFNLLGNAVKFTDTGSVSLIVESCADERGRAGLHFQVRDTGIGIAPEAMAHIFDPFAQADSSTTRRFGGTGLGLSISSKLVALLGGAIWCESVPDHGSTFHFTVYLDAYMNGHTAAAPLPGPSPAATQGPAQPQIIAPRILLAEDHPVNQLLVTKLLTAQGYEVVHAVNGAEAVRRAAESGFDVVLMDVRMPVLDGLAATQQIRAQEAPSGRRVPIIALTVEGEREMVNACLEAGMDGFVAKPVRADDLVAEIQRHL